MVNSLSYSTLLSIQLCMQSEFLSLTKPFVYVAPGGIITDRPEGGNCGKAVLTTTTELRMLPSDSNLRSLRRLVLEQDVT